ncbi:hypothetical protein J4763_07130 [Burkholderia pseudomallei]|uniref:hypothetical protein n=1 Tax=Burkholderia pseudomallei TaxID=28450 RepID=UPI001AAE5E83|nr:hypothetical protein [Burkholderia pseudomallei]MBO3056562.1 hypothetical protein [Burkholderia pseudomallei]
MSDSNVVSFAAFKKNAGLAEAKRESEEHWDRPLDWVYPEFQPGPHYQALCFKFHLRVIEGQGHVWLEYPEEHQKALGFFELFGLDYNEYASLPDRGVFDVLQTLYFDAALHAILYLENPARFRVATAHLPATYSRWIKAVALNQQLVVRRLAKEGLSALLDSVAAHAAQYEGVPMPENLAEQVTRLNDLRRPRPASDALWWAKTVRDWGLEARVPYFSSTAIGNWPFPSFEIDENGRSYIADADLHEQFSAILRAFGYEYRDIAPDHALLERLSEVVVGALGQMVPEKQIAKEQFGQRFGQCSPALQRWIRACCSGRRETMLKLRDQVWPELQDWAKKNPPRKGKITALGPNGLRAHYDERH